MFWNVLETPSHTLNYQNIRTVTVWLAGLGGLGFGSGA